MGAKFYKNVFGHGILLLQNNKCLPLAFVNVFMESRLGDALLEGSRSECAVTLTFPHTILTFPMEPRPLSSCSYSSGT